MSQGGAGGVLWGALGIDWPVWKLSHTLPQALPYWCAPAACSHLLFHFIFSRTVGEDSIFLFNHRGN